MGPSAIFDDDGADDGGVCGAADYSADADGAAPADDSANVDNDNSWQMSDQQVSLVTLR